MPSFPTGVSMKSIRSISSRFKGCPACSGSFSAVRSPCRGAASSGSGRGRPSCREGETIKLSKRSGKAITLNTLIDEVPLDAARFFFNLREPNSHFDFDLELAAKQSSENPVYYVQYAHARICSIIKKAQEQGVELKTPSDDELALLNSKEEKDLIRHLSLLTDEIVSAAKSYDPAKITHYVIELATLFHKFYNAQRVMLDDNEGLMQARLFLCKAVKDTIYNILTMLKITAPEVM